MIRFFVEVIPAWDLQSPRRPTGNDFPRVKFDDLVGGEVLVNSLSDLPGFLAMTLQSGSFVKVRREGLQHLGEFLSFDP